MALRATFIRVAEGKVDGLFFVFSGGRSSVVGRRWWWSVASTTLEASRMPVFSVKPINTHPVILNRENLAGGVKAGKLTYFLTVSRSNRIPPGRTIT